MITINNIGEITFDQLLETIQPYFGAIPPATIPSPEADLYFYNLPQWNAYFLGLWAKLDHLVRDVGDKSQISKRDLLEKAMSQIKFAYESTSRRLTSKQTSVQMTGERCINSNGGF